MKNFELMLLEDLQKSMDRAEKELILYTLDLCNHHSTRTAARLGIDRKSLYNKLHKHGIPIKRERLGLSLPDIDKAADALVKMGRMGLSIQNINTQQQIIRVQGIVTPKVEYLAVITPWALNDLIYVKRTFNLTDLGLEEVALNSTAHGYSLELVAGLIRDEELKTNKP